MLNLANQYERKISNYQSSQVGCGLQGASAADGLQRPPGKRGGPVAGHRGEHHLPLEEPQQSSGEQRGRSYSGLAGTRGTAQADSGTGDRAGHFKKSLGHFQSTDLRQRYEFIRSVADEFSVSTLCEMLKVSRTAYYRYQRGGSYQVTAAKEEQLGAVGEIFWQHKRRYGQRRVLAELQEQGYSIGRHRVRSLMQQQGLRAIQPRSFVPRTSDSRHGKRICANLLLEQPLPTAPNQVWVSDITYLSLADGNWAYLGSWMRQDQQTCVSIGSILAHDCGLDSR